jgi:hypothetical protein
MPEMRGYSSLYLLNPRPGKSPANNLHGRSEPVDKSVVWNVGFIDKPSAAAGQDVQGKAAHAK